MENTLLICFITKNIKSVRTFSAKHKLGDMGKEVKGVKNYSLRQKMAIAMCREYAYVGPSLTPSTPGEALNPKP